MSLGRALTPAELSVLHLVADEVREIGIEKAQSYWAMEPVWREIVDAILGVDNETPEDEADDDAPFGEIFDGLFDRKRNGGLNG